MDRSIILFICSLAGLKISGVVTAWLMHRGHKNEVTKLTLLYLVLGIIAFIAQGMAGDHPARACFVVSLWIPAVFIMAKLSDLLFATNLPRYAYLKFTIGSQIIAALLWPITENFYLCAAITSWPVAFSILHMVWRIYISPQKKPVEAMLLIVGQFICAIHVLDYPFLRLNTEYQAVGFSVAYFIEAIQLLGLIATVAAHIRVTYTSKLEREIKIASQELQESESMKTNLIRILCHDVTNGLMVLQQSIKRMKINEKDEASSKSLANGLSALSSQLQLLENVRTAVAVSSGKTHLQIKSTDLKEAVKESLANLTPALTHKKISVLLTFCDEAVFVDVDRTLLVHSIVGNILSNAIKFSSVSGEVHVKVDSPNRLVIKDNGVGMDTTKLKHIFEANSPTNSLGTLGETGSGFGLVIVHNLLKQMNATLEVDSNASSTNGSATGTTFSIFFKSSE